MPQLMTPAAAALDRLLPMPAQSLQAGFGPALQMAGTALAVLDCRTARAVRNDGRAITGQASGGRLA